MEDIVAMQEIVAKALWPGGHETSPESEDPDGTTPPIHQHDSPQQHDAPVTAHHLCDDADPGSVALVPEAVPEAQDHDDSSMMQRMAAPQVEDPASSSDRSRSPLPTIPAPSTYHGAPRNPLLPIYQDSPTATQAVHMCTHRSIHSTLRRLSALLTFLRYEPEPDLTIRSPHMRDLVTRAAAFLTPRFTSSYTATPTSAALHVQPATEP